MSGPCKERGQQERNKTIKLRTRLSRIIVGCVLIIILLKVHEIDQEGRGKNENTLSQSGLRRENNNEGIGIGELVSITKKSKKKYGFTNTGGPFLVNQALLVGSLIEDVKVNGITTLHRTETELR